MSLDHVTSDVWGMSNFCDAKAFVVMRGNAETHAHYWRVMRHMAETGISPISLSSRCMPRESPTDEEHFPCMLYITHQIARPLKYKDKGHRTKYRTTILALSSRLPTREIERYARLSCSRGICAATGSAKRGDPANGTQLPRNPKRFWRGRHGRKSSLFQREKGW
jgi:hypothetical protein